MKEFYANFHVYEYKPPARVKCRQLDKSEINKEPEVITIRSPIIVSKNFYESFPYIFNELVNINPNICETNGHCVPSVV